MDTQLRIDSRNLDIPPSVSKRIQRQVSKLERVFDRLTSCRVTLQRPSGHPRNGGLYNVRLDLGVPGKTIIVSRHHAENLAVAVRQAFDAARRKLEEHSRIRRHQVKRHREVPQGQVHRIFPEAGYGFIQDAEGREVYFHRHSVGEDVFAALHVGDWVQFTEEQGDEGPRVRSLSLL